MTDLPQTRQSLLVRLQDSADAAAWRTFVDVYAPAVFAFARRNGLQPADAADVTQDVCRNVVQAMRSAATTRTGGGSAAGCSRSSAIS